VRQDRQTLLYVVLRIAASWPSPGFQGTPPGTADHIGLLTDAAGFPLMVEAFEGNAAETTRMLPTIRAFMAAHQLADVTIVADAGMVFDGTVVRARNGAVGDPRSVSERYTVRYRLAAARRHTVPLLGRSRRRGPSPSRRS
jgi:hypothetical protein